MLGDRVGVTLLPSLNYKEMLYLLSRCLFVMTDSGGLQEEAPSFGKTTLVLRDITERPEGIATGFSKLIGTERNNIVDQVDKILNNPAKTTNTTNKINPYGDGNATEKIIGALEMS